MLIRIPKINVLLTLLSVLVGMTFLQAQKSGTSSIKRVVIDAGHGGKDPGACYRGVQEKKITLAITLKLGKMIERYLDGVEVIYTRKSDHFIPLHKRAEIANKAKADVFVSLHCNYFRDKTKRGTETFVMGLHKIQSNLDVAKRENAVVKYEQDADIHYDFDVNSPEGHIYLSMYQNAALEQSIVLADMIERSFVRHLYVNNRGVKQAGFYVLHKTSMPSVLIEAGFLTNDEDRKILTSESGQQKVAESIFKAIVKYFGKEIPEDAQYAFSNKKPVNRPSPVPVVKKSRKPSKRYYMVQIAATSKSRKDILKKIPNCTEEKVGAFYKYKVGKFATYEEASACRTKMLAEGFDGAFIIKY